MTAAQVVIALPADSADAVPFRTAPARFGDRIALTFATGEELARALPDAEIVVALGLSDDELVRAQRLRWLSSWAAALPARPGPERRSAARLRRPPGAAGARAAR